jgi:choline dehydrogenase
VHPTDYDYIIVGGGTAGCVLAARLSANGPRVLLLEAGDKEATESMTVPNAWPTLTGSPADWCDVTTAQADTGPVPYPRGRALGGSGAINAMAHVRGHRAVYDAWDVPGWDFQGLLPYFKRAESTKDRDPALRGTEGPVPVAPVPEPDRHPAARAFAEALAGIGCPATDDLSGRHQEGAAWLDLAIAAGQRVGPADAYLRPVLARPNLTIHANALATRLRVENGRCTAVEYRTDGTPARAHATAEMIVCAGAIGTPQLLMLSGLGPAEHLRSHGIAPVADIPEVGGNLQDHPMTLVSFATPEPLPRSRYNHGELYAALRSPRSGAWPDLHLFPILLPLAPPGRQGPPAGFTLVASAMAPDSRGTLRLASADPAQPPLIDPGFLRDPRDQDRMEAGLALLRQAAADPAFLKATEVWPGPETSRDYIRRTLTSYHHPSGTCRMGTDPAAVVDPDLKVRGVEGLRIADASIIPIIPNANTNATVLAIAEKAADLITGLNSKSIYPERTVVRTSPGKCAGPELSASISAATAGWRRILSRQRPRIGPMLPIGMPSLALISAYGTGGSSASRAISR